MTSSTVDVAPWQMAWLKREMPALRWYTDITSLSLSFAVLTFGMMAFFGIRRCTKALRTELSDRAQIFKDMNACVLRTTRAQLWIALIYLLHTLALALADAAIGVMVVKDAGDERSWNAGFVAELVLYGAYCLVVFTSAMIVAPLLQLLVATFFLTRYARKHGANALARCLPEARFLTTHLGQLWASVAFWIEAWWPGDQNSMLRMILLQAAIGSAMAWLDASFAFNYCADRLVEQDFACSPEIKKIVVCFGETVKAVHTGEKGADVLPKYEDAVKCEQTPLVEKEG